MIILIALVCLAVIASVVVLVVNKRETRVKELERVNSDNFILSRALNQIKEDALTLNGVGDGLALADSILYTIKKEEEKLYNGIQPTYITQGRN